MFVVFVVAINIFLSFPRPSTNLRADSTLPTSLLILIYVRWVSARPSMTATKSIWNWAVSLCRAIRPMFAGGWRMQRRKGSSHIILAVRNPTSLWCFDLLSSDTLLTTSTPYLSRPSYFHSLLSFYICCPTTDWRKSQ